MEKSMKRKTLEMFMTFPEEVRIAFAAGKAMGDAASKIKKKEETKTTEKKPA